MSIHIGSAAFLVAFFVGCRIVLNGRWAQYRREVIAAQTLGYLGIAVVRELAAFDVLGMTQARQINGWWMWGIALIHLQIVWIATQERWRRGRRAER